MTDETKRKIGENNKGIKNYFYGKLSYNFGKKLSNKTKKLIGISNKKWHKENIHPMLGKHHTQNTILKIKQKLTNKNLGMKNPKYDKTIYNFTNIKTYENFIGTRYELINKYNLSQSNLSSLIKGKRKSVKNWIVLF
jgi:Mor family transcriptional regulator